MAEPEWLVGLVEHPERGNIERFHGAAELLNILLAPARTDETVMALKKKISRVSGYR